MNQHGYDSNKLFHDCSIPDQKIRSTEEKCAIINDDKELRCKRTDEQLKIFFSFDTCARITI
jgi:hypothetical protein